MKYCLNPEFPVPYRVHICTFKSTTLLKESSNMYNVHESQICLLREWILSLDNKTPSLDISKTSFTYLEKL